MNYPRHRNPLPPTRTPFVTSPLTSEKPRRRIDFQLRDTPANRCRHCGSVSFDVRVFEPEMREYQALPAGEYPRKLEGSCSSCDVDLGLDVMVVIRED